MNRILIADGDKKTYRMSFICRRCPGVVPISNKNQLHKEGLCDKHYKLKVEGERR